LRRKIEILEKGIDIFKEKLGISFLELDLENLVDEKTNKRIF
jgi:hypothetical protein